MRRYFAVLLAGVLLAGLAACSGKSAGGDDTSSSGGDGALSVKTDDGTVKLDAKATKVVALEWVYVEDLMSLGVTPIGAADVEGYNTWVSSTDPLGKDVTDVGTRQEPSIEKIKQLKPDLIVADSNRTDIAFEELRDIAPLVTYNFTKDGRTQVDGMHFIVEQLAVATGTESEAEKLASDLDSAIADGKKALADAEGTPYALTQAYTMEGTPEFRMFGETSMAVEVLTELGLHNTWDGKLDEWGMTTVGVEGLTKLPDDTNFLYLAVEADNPFTGALKDNDVWNDLPFVKDDKVSAIDSGTWMFGGAASCIQLVDETVRVLTK
jgi:ABC-type Fe3+-citrate transport system substrate-binding protein